MFNKMWMVLAIASLALVGCNDSDDIVAGAAPAEVVPVGGPLGLLYNAPVSVMSADVDADVNTVRVSDELASVTLNALTFDGEGNVATFSITLGLPDGSDVTFTDESEGAGGPIVEVGDGHVALLMAENDEGDVVQVAVGLGLSEPGSVEEALDEALFVAARVDPANEEALSGFETYMVTGAETAALPGGEATYDGISVASVYREGELVDDQVVGSVNVSVSFGDSMISSINIDGAGADADYSLSGTDIPIVGSRYGGVDVLSGWVETNACEEGSCEADVTGDLKAAFYGTDAEATAGVVGASGTDDDEGDIEVIGAFGAYKVAPE